MSTGTVPHDVTQALGRWQLNEGDCFASAAPSPVTGRRSVNLTDKLGQPSVVLHLP